MLAKNQGLMEEHNLSFERFPAVGLAKTYNTNQQTPDSAGTMTALITGEKTKAGVLSIAAKVARADTNACSRVTHHYLTR